MARLLQGDGASVKIACDNCQRVDDEDLLMGWVETSLLGSRSGLSDKPANARFCCVACLVVYFSSNRTSVTRERRDQSSASAV